MEKKVGKYSLKQLCLAPSLKKEEQLVQKNKGLMIFTNNEAVLPSFIS